MENDLLREGVRDGEGKSSLYPGLCLAHYSSMPQGLRHESGVLLLFFFLGHVIVD